MNREEFCSIYVPLGEMLYKLAYYILESASDAEDSVQDLYIKLWNNRDVLCSINNPKAYCVTLLRNICIDKIRKRREYYEIDVGDEPIGIRGPSEEIEEKESLKRVMTAIGKLPETQRKILHMRVFEELSYDEIAKRTGINKLTLRVMLSRARNKIRKQ